MYGEGFDNAQERLLSQIRERYGTSAFAMSAVGVSVDVTENGTSNPEAQKELSLVLRRNAIVKMLEYDVAYSRRDNIQTPTETTCDWILSYPQYIAWMRNEEALLWIKGKPGAGKSVLMRYLDDKVSEAVAGKETVARFYFNARGESLEKSFAGLYRSLITQLFQAEPALATVVDEYRPNITKLSALTRLLSLRDLQQMLTRAVSRSSRRVRLLIDALDECREEDVGDLVEYLHRTKLQVCLASRHYPILEVPTSLQLTIEKVGEHTIALDAYLQANLKFGRDKLESIKEAVLSKARGVFLWVVIVVKILQKEFRNGRIHAVRARLRSIPPGLSELFTDIVRRDNEHMDEFTLCLKWLLFAKRPLRLEEWYFAMISWFEPEHLLWRKDEVDETVMRSFLLSSSKGFAEVAFYKVQFIHESVTDFLLKDDGFQELCKADSFGGLVAHAHEQLKTCCVRGMDQKIAAIFKTLTQKVLPFAEYATEYVLEHAELASRACSQASFTTQDFKYQEWALSMRALGLEVPAVKSDAHELTSLCIVKDFAGLLEVLMSGAGLERILSLCSTAIWHRSWASLTFLLLRSGATNATDIVSDIRNVRESLLWEQSQLWKWAVHNGLHKLLEHLIGSIPVSEYTWQTSHGSSNILILAIESKALSMVEYVTELAPQLLRATFHMRADRQSTPLVLAAERGCKDILTYLLQNGPPVVWSLQFEEPLEWACHNLSVKEVKSLLEEGIHAQYYELPSFSWSQMDVSLAELLVQHGLNVSTQDELGRSPLHYAALNHNADVAGVLCRQADVNLQDLRGATPLHLAAFSTETIVLVHTLMAAGADTEIRDEQGRTPILNVIGSSRITDKEKSELVQLLGISADTRDSNGHNALTLACLASCSVSLMETLLGADTKAISTSSSLGEVLSLAVKHCDHAVASLLVERGYAF